MSRNHEISRRSLFRLGLGTVAAILLQRVAAVARAASRCIAATPEQTAGPFYPTHEREDEDPDLTRVKGRTGRAAGQVVWVRGRVLDEACAPVAGALVEIWQANTWGRYDHERDADNPRRLDPNFQGWAKMRTDSDGHYAFKTIKPGSYPNGPGSYRTPHIHFKVTQRGHEELTTQLYFEGEALNQNDGVRSALTAEERQRVTVAFRPAPDVEKSALRGDFDITLRRAG